MLYNIFRVKGGNIMTFRKPEFNLKKDDTKIKIINIASEYWADRIKNAGERQISYEMGNGIIPLSSKELVRFKRNFLNVISKVYFHIGTGIMLWTPDGKHFNDIGTDSYLRSIMKSSNLSLTCLPSDVCMMIYSNKIVVEEAFEQSIIYSKVK